MDTVQLAIADASYAAALREMLERGGTREVCRVEVPDPDREGVIVVDPEGLDRLPLSLIKPDRVVLVTRNDPSQLSRAWNAGIRSVVFSDDPLNTAVLAIMAAELRLSKSGWTGSGGLRAGSEPLETGGREGARRDRKF